MITKRQKQILDFISVYNNKKGYSPSLKEIKKHFRLSSESTVHQHVKSLETKGYLQKEKNQPRAINVTEGLDMIGIPVLGNIAAGQPIEALEIFDEKIFVPKENFFNFGKYYALKVVGDSMIDEGIFDGDTVVIREQKTAENGQTVVAIIDDNEATLKKIYKETDQIRLEPANPTLFPIYRSEVEVRGVVVKIIRNLEVDKNKEGFFIKEVYSFPYTKNAKRVSNTSEKGVKPFLQWVGGKRSMIDQYKNHFPLKFNTYIEPFLGGGAMFFYLKPRKAILNDSNLELIKSYEGVRDNPDDTINILRELKKRHSKDLYMRVRELDRYINIFDELESHEIASRMIYLNQTGFNGVYRVNKSGQFNVPIGSSLNRLICDPETIKLDSSILKQAEIFCDDFEKILRKAKKNDFIYLDPPYQPISKYSDFTRYTKEKFFENDQVRLKEEIDRLSKVGAKVMLSNSDSNFIRDLYRNYKIIEVESGRSLNCKSDRRGKVKELLIINY